MKLICTINILNTDANGYQPGYILFLQPEADTSLLLLVFKNIFKPIVNTIGIIDGKLYCQ